MSNNQQNNQPKAHVDVRTNSIAFFDSRSYMFKLSFYGDSIGASIIAPVNVGGKNTWPKENQVSILLTRERVAALYQLIQEKFLAKVAENIEYDCGVFLNKDKTNIFDIANVPDTGIVVSIFQNIDADRIPGKIDAFEFSPMAYPEKYNPKTGDVEVKEIHANFFLFVKAIESFVFSISGSVSHAERVYNGYSMTKALRYLSQVAAKMGIVEPQNENNPSWGNNQSSGFDNNVMNSIEESSNLEALL